MTDMAHISFLADTLPCAVRILKAAYRTDSVFHIFFLELVDHGDRRSSGSLALISDSLKILFKKDFKDVSLHPTCVELPGNRAMN